MGLNDAMNAGVTALNADTSAINAISDNIANQNTVGYKKAVVNFSSMVSYEISKNVYTSGGVSAITHNLISEQGVTTSTGNDTDLAIVGSGLFVTSQNSPLAANLTTPAYTRSGSFVPDAQGYLKNTSGNYLLGWVADANGVITPSSTDISQLQPINVRSAGGAASATTSASLNGNLNPTTTPSIAATALASAAYNATTNATAYDPSQNSMSMYGVNNATGVKPDFSATMQIVDSQGAPHNMELDLLKSATANTWYAEVRVVPASDITSTNGQLASGTLAFTPTGQIDAANSTLLNASTGLLNLNIGASSGSSGTRWASNLGLAAQPLSLNMTTSPGGFTQFSGTSQINSVTSNGTTYSQLSKVTVDNQGFLTALYENGVSRKIAQVAVATFPNVDGLNALSGEAYQASVSSGLPIFNQPGSGASGSIDSQNLEDSTVDISGSLTQLIQMQRSYSASSKIISVPSQLLQDTIDLIR